ncbi:MAG: hypothetical protein ABSD98_04485 [Candidatus Korobacteraceae bacterium]
MTTEQRVADSITTEVQGGGPHSPVTLPVSERIGGAWEAVSKNVATLGATVYICGFLITSIYHSSYGFAETNPFRPRILAAGAWFLLFTSVPIFSVTRFRGKDPLQWKSFAEFLYPYFVGCMFLGFPAAAVFDLTGNGKVVAPLRWWGMLGIVIALAIFVFIQSWKKTPPLVTSIVSIAFVAYFVQAVWRQMVIAGEFQIGAIPLWLFGVGVITLLELNARSGGLPEGDWTKTTIPVLAAVFIFATFYYPHIKAAWGGGAPLTVTLFLTKDVATDLGGRASVRLLDESDQGLYVLRQNDTRATFIPRSSISMIYYSDKSAQ